jgi:TetR/AcrR family tetracycline transcriptional repressor
MDEQKRVKQLERLAEARERAQKRMATQQQRIDKRFDALEERITPREGKPTDSQQRIITAALELLDEEGLNELSLRKLAAKVGLKAPALYWYFKNKEELVDYMAEAILASEFAELTVRTNDESWQDWLVTACKRLRTAMLSRRDGARIVAGAHLYPAVTLAQLMETASASLSTAGLSDENVDLIVGTAVHFTFGRVIEEQSSPSLEEIQEMDFKDVADKYPRLARNIERIQASGNVVGFSDGSFEQAVRLIVR